MDEKRPPRDAEDLTADSVTSEGDSPHIAQPSVVVAIDPRGRLGPGVRLKDIEEDPAPPRLHAGPEKYEVLKLQGRGGMGKVYQVYDRDLKRKVALKMILDPTSDRQARFLEEAQIQAQLEHPNILPVHELGLTEKRKPYYTMPVVSGQTLQATLQALRQGDAKTTRTYSITRLIQVFLQIGQAVQYAHDKGVLHRDLKPANVILGEHGEVRLVDWGLSKPLDADGRDRTLTREGHVVGTPAYMSPEQAVPLELDARSDLYSLGVVLYEMLTLHLPFDGDSVHLLRAHMSDPPPPLRARAPGRDVPLELERICLKALEKRREDRYPSVGEMLEALQGWLESEADRAKRHQRAEERVAESQEKLDAYRKLRSRIGALEGEFEVLTTRFKSWQSVGEKAELLAAEDCLEAARDELPLLASEVVGTLTEALGFEHDNPTARALLSDYYWERFAEAEHQGDRRSRDALGKLVARFDDGRRRGLLLGTGSLTLASEPAGADATLHEYVERDLLLVPREVARLGPTPIREHPLAMGSYLVVLRHPGYRDVRYPISIGRNQAWAGTVHLHTAEELGQGFLHVPAGPFVQGGEEGEKGRMLPRVEASLDDFFISEFPVTMGEYLEFLNHLAKKDPALALTRSPRRGPMQTSYLRQLPDGSLALPEIDADGDRWDPRWPAFLVSCEDAHAYCEWLGERSGWDCRLPSSAEWEKAARGVDGRTYPWGNRFDPSLCNVRESQAGRPGPAPVDGYPSDVSPYGVRGLAGNVQEWTSTAIDHTEVGETREYRIVRGGGWDTATIDARTGRRHWNSMNNLTHMLGFRVVRSARLRREPR